MSWLAAFTDLPTGVARLRRRNLSGLDFFPAFLTLLVFAALLVPFGQALGLFDLSPTWGWISVLRTPPELAGDAAFTWDTALACAGSRQAHPEVVKRFILPQSWCDDGHNWGRDWAMRGGYSVVM
jgi:hypothetical protein